MKLFRCSYIFFVILLMLLDGIQIQGISAHQKYDSPCYIAEGEAFLCDHKEFLRCSNGTCICFRGYRYNSIIEKCEHDHSEHLMRRKREPDYSEYLKRQKREPGKALPGETCHLSGDCVVGLYCVGDVCKCPNPCKYEKDEGICDCGNVDLDFPTNAKAVTIILSILSVAIWGYVIRRTYKAGKKRNTQNNDDENVDENRPLEMNPLNEPNKPDYGGQDNFQAPSYPPPPYSSVDERKDCAPFYPGEGPAPDMSAWKVTPMSGPPNTTTNLTSESQADAVLPFGATSGGGNTSNTGISASSLVSPVNVTPVVTSNSQEGYLPYSMPSQQTPSLSGPSIGATPPASLCTTHQNTSEDACLPYSINPSNMPSTLPPAPPSAGVLPTTTPYTSGSSTAPPYTTGSPTAPPYTINPSTAPPYTADPSTAPPYTTDSSTAPPYATGSSTAPPPYTTEPSTSPPYTAWK